MDDLALTVVVLVVDHLTLGTANFLDDDLLGRLGRDSAELPGVDLHADLIVGFALRVVLQSLLERDLGVVGGIALDHRFELEQLDLTRLQIELGLDLALRAQLAPRSRHHRLLERVDDDVPVDALVFADLIDDAAQIQFHGQLHLCRRRQTSPLRGRRPPGIRLRECECPAGPTDRSGPGDAFERDREHLALGSDLRFAAVERIEAAAEPPPTRQRLARLDRNGAADRALEVLLARQYAVHAGRGDLKQVSPGDHVVRVEAVTDLARNPGALVNGHPAVPRVVSTTTHTRVRPGPP